MQPYLLELYGDEKAYSVAGLAAAIVAGAQILGGYLAPRIRRLFARRTSALIAGAAASVMLLASLGLTTSFALALFLLVLWGLVFAAVMPIRQAYLNGMIPSEQRATVLSFDSLMGNTGRRLHPARPGQGGRCLELRHLVRDRRRLPGAWQYRSCF